MDKILLCSECLPEKIAEIFKGLRYDVAYVPKCNYLSPAVASHPDMLFSVIGERALLTDYNYFEDNRSFFEALSQKGVKISFSEKRLSEKYPLDVLFDAIKSEKLLVGNLKHTAPELFSEDAKQENVRQGYALCSTLLMKSAAVSADAGICKALGENGYNVLRIAEGDIELKGYGHGFIGGASAVLEDIKAVVFFGNIDAHKDGDRIVSFCKDNGYTVYCEKSLPLTDYGGVKAI